MNEAGREIAILSLGQILAIAQEEIMDNQKFATLERHVRQVAAILQGKPNNKPDRSTETLLSQVGELLKQLEVA
jgi:hypothetical protein